MASFKRFDNQIVQVVSVALASSTATWNVGDLFSYVTSTGIGAKITKASEVEAALGLGKKVFMIAQGDAVTNKKGTAYKTYTLAQTVAMSDSAKDVAAYDVTDVNNIEGYAAEA